MYLGLRAESVAKDGRCIREEPTEMEKKSTWASRVTAACWKEVCQTVTPQYILMTLASRRISAKASLFARPFFWIVYCRLSHFSVACLITQASSGGVIFQCSLEDAEVSVAFLPFLSDQIVHSRCLCQN